MAGRRKIRFGRVTLGTIATLSLVVILMGVKGCPANKIFPHKTHIEAELNCTDCHQGAKSAEDAGLPTPEACQDCHQVEDKQYEKVAVLVAKGEFKWPASDLLYGEELIFSHKTHADAEIDCEVCHGKVGDTTQITRKNLPQMALCMECHQEMAISTDCKTCHKEIRKDVKPKSHQLGWEWNHGREVQLHGFDGGEMGQDCSLCHTQSSCTQCHQRNPPRSHNQYWRLRGHGIDASTDRAECSVCHQTDFCIRCHQENAPVSHMGAWGSPLNQHCMACHDANTATNCSVCHMGTPSHLNQAPRLPPVVPAHSFSNTCMSCHSAGPKAVRHFTNGSDGAYCRSCHR